MRALIAPTDKKKGLLSAQDDSSPCAMAAHISLASVDGVPTLVDRKNGKPWPGSDKRVARACRLGVGGSRHGNAAASGLTLFDFTRCVERG